MDSEVLQGLRVLVVDDQAHVRTWVRSVLLGFGIRDVVEAASGREAMSMVIEPAIGTRRQRRSASAFPVRRQA